MGAVPVKVVDSFSYHGDFCLTYAVYIYCDNCGSFDIKKALSFRQWLWIVSSCLLGAAMIGLKYLPIMSSNKLYTFRNVDWPILFGALLVLVLFVFLGPPAYRCRKCRNFTTIRYNTRDYPSEDLSIIDVPDQQVQEYGLRGWPVDQPIEAYLSPPKNNLHKE